jgi:hypothetical protein
VSRRGTSRRTWRCSEGGSGAGDAAGVGPGEISKRFSAWGSYTVSMPVVMSHRYRHNMHTNLSQLELQGILNDDSKISNRRTNNRLQI